MPKNREKYAATIAAREQYVAQNVQRAEESFDGSADHFSRIAGLYREGAVAARRNGHRRNASIFKRTAQVLERRTK